MAGAPPEPLRAPPFSVASPVPATAVGAPFGVVDTVMLKVSLAARLPRSLAVPRTAIVPTSADVGVPLKVRVEGSQKGRAEPLAVIAARGAHTLV